MLCLKNYGFEFWDNINKYVCEKYIIEPNKFIRSRKMSQKDVTIYPLVQNGRTNAIEALSFIRELTGDDDMTITKQAIGKQRGYLSPLLYKDMGDDFVDGLYVNFEDLEKFKGYMILACDGSIIDLPNTKLTKNEFNVPEDTVFKEYLSRARASCIVDVNSEYILTSEITDRNINELTLAKIHLKNLNERINLNNSIIIYDRGYSSLELMLYTSQLNSNFLIRLPKSYFKKEREHMKSDDETVEININKSRIHNFKDSELIKVAQEMGTFELRITNVELETGEIETLISNLSFDEFSKEDLKELYSKRWKIETNYDRLKNRLKMENFTGHRKIIIEQDFYANILIFNYLIYIKHEAEEEAFEKRKEVLRFRYKVNVNVLFGLIKMEIPKLLTENPKQRKKIVNRISDIAQRNLVVSEKKKSDNGERKTPDYTSKHHYNQRRAC